MHSLWSMLRVYKRIGTTLIYSASETPTPSFQLQAWPLPKGSGYLRKNLWGAGLGWQPRRSPRSYRWTLDKEASSQSARCNPPHPESRAMPGPVQQCTCSWLYDQSCSFESQPLEVLLQLSLPQQGLVLALQPLLLRLQSLCSLNQLMKLHPQSPVLLDHLLAVLLHTHIRLLCSREGRGRASRHSCEITACLCAPE